MRTTLWLSALLAIAGTGVAVSAATPIPIRAGPAGLAGDYPALVAEYDQALLDWRNAIKDAERGQKAELRKKHPAMTFWSRFEEAGHAGEGRALLWLAQHLKDADVPLKERGPKSIPYFQTLVAKHREAEWFASVLNEIDKSERRIGRDNVRAFYETIATKTEREATRVQGMFQLADLLSDSEDQEDRARADELYETIATTYPGTDWGREAQKVLAGRNLQPGRPAPDFDARTVDGHEFKLSDYRGKVVLLDFYGFW